MDELSKVALPALIALIGTSVTTFVGYRQWKRQHDITRQSRFQTDRQAASERREHPMRSTYSAGGNVI